MADLIATEAYALSIGKANVSYTSNLCCTKSRAIALGCNNIVGTYANNLLVCLKDLKPNTYWYKVSFTPSSTIGSNLYRVFILSNMDSSLVGTKKNIAATGVTTNYTIYSTANTSGIVGLFTGTQCTNLGGPITMVNGYKYSVLYTVVSPSSATGFPGNVTIPWKRVCEFTFYSSTYYYTLNVTA